MSRETGVVKWFDEEKNYGFITPDGNHHKDIFFYRTDLDNLERTIEAGTRVEYEPEQGPKGREARRVRPLDE